MLVCVRHFTTAGGASPSTVRSRRRCCWTGRPLSIWRRNDDRLRTFTVSPPGPASIWRGRVSPSRPWSISFGPPRGWGSSSPTGRTVYNTNLSLEDATTEDVLLAYELQGQPLPLEHGGPLRLLVPQRYAWKSAKFLRRLEFRVEDAPGYWEQRGYHDRGDPWQEERYR
ncbi:MAG TPA: hypothetical protein EYQ31_11975 [Candidatus Handelsmanbacteria bacterium]|nr:hypothetical protein [Candidatus Handelsmanbacteria bacterium]